LRDIRWPTKAKEEKGKVPFSSSAVVRLPIGISQVLRSPYSAPYSLEGGKCKKSALAGPFGVPTSRNVKGTSITCTPATEEGRGGLSIQSQVVRLQFQRLLLAVSNAHIEGGERDVFVQHLSDLVLVCKTLSSPKPPERVVWLRDGRRIDTLLARGGISVVTDAKRRTSRLLVSKVNAGDAGNYTCAPSNARPDHVAVHVIQGNRGHASYIHELALHLGADTRANVMASAAKVNVQLFFPFVTVLILRI